MEYILIFLILILLIIASFLNNSKDRLEKKITDEENYVIELISINKDRILEEIYKSTNIDFFKKVINDDRRNIIDNLFLKYNYKPKYISKDRIYDFSFSCIDILYNKKYLSDFSINDISFSDFNANTIPTKGRDFEFWVAKNLAKHGWETTVTPHGSDQGVDVIAKMNGVSVAIQCKLYSSNVGNKAVQEVFSGMNYYGLKKSIVITNSDYTKSAKDLAKKNGVILVNHSDIPKLSKILNITS